ncbi:glycerophosphodiester phosphodiesterase GDPD4 isoform X2 [Camellia sinensis]|uniref:glycerophosphodiester phosphodiesterase GDPD4 isoform X2 n=1 Tax=Camellia sinensis TaxID=4442 RepID=UPI0010360065|nr:glycerophosphodiester phosphodiesterase GDPD4 isoform X2 [Camellia sinensis]
MAISRLGRRQQVIQQRHGLWRNRNLRGFASGKSFRFLLLCLVLIAILPPIFFHFKLRHFHQMAAYHTALHSRVDCIEIDVSRSSDGILFALHDRDLQQISGNSTSKVGHLSVKEIKELDHDQNIPTVEDALKLISSSVRQIILDAKVGPPSYEKGLAKDILSVVERTQCKNCLVWTKSDNLARDVMKLSPDVMVGYIVMKDPSTGARNNLLRMRGASVVGVFHPLIDEKLMKILHGRNKKVYAWTVDDQASMKKMLYENVDAVVTSNPTLLQHLMQDIRTQCLEEGFSLS